MKALKLSIQLIERRDDVRRMLGDVLYDDGVGDARAILRGLCKQNGESLAHNALRVSEGMTAAGHDPSLVIAAFVDECEFERRIGR